MDNNKLARQWLTRNDKAENLVHSSGYAKEQSGANIGAAGGESFAERQALEQKRQFIQSYKNSQLASRRQNRYDRAKSYQQYRGQVEAANLTEVAETRARERVREPNGLGGSPVAQKVQKVQPKLADAKAPSIPTRRAGI